MTDALFMLCMVIYSGLGIVFLYAVLGVALTEFCRQWGRRDGKS